MSKLHHTQQVNDCLAVKYNDETWIYDAFCCSLIPAEFKIDFLHYTTMGMLFSFGIN